MKKVFIKTFGCIQNEADSDQIRHILSKTEYGFVDDWKKANLVIINSCVVRQSAENRVYGLIENITKYNDKIQIVVTGCLAGWINKNYDKKRSVKKNYPQVVFKKIENFSIWQGLATVLDKKLVVPISFGCNNYCSYCVVPFSRGSERSRPFNKIIRECEKGISGGAKELLLVGQNVNSYGSDLVGSQKSITIDGLKIKPIMVKSMGKKRIPTIFPYLLAKVADMGFDKVSFVSSNPWDFSNELIKVIKNHPNIDRLIHLPIQSGNDQILSKMNRGYTVDEYMKLVGKLRKEIEDVKIGTDIIVGFPGETDDIFEESLRNYKKIGFSVAYINKYSHRNGTLACRLYEDDVPHKLKRARWLKLDKLINKNLV